VQFAAHLFAILLGTRPSDDGVPALALRALSLCFVPDFDRALSSSAPAPVDQDTLMRSAEAQGALRSLKLYGGTGSGVEFLPERLRSRTRGRSHAVEIVRFSSSAALYADMVPEDFRLCNLDPDPYVQYAYL
jgi:hypothetical protein